MNFNNRKKCPVIVLCLLFVFSIFIIPAIVGIVLYVRNVFIDKENKKLTEELETNRQAELNHLKSLLTPEQNEAINLEKEIFNYKKQISDLKTEISNKQDDISAINRKISELTQKESTIKSEIYNYTEMVEMQQFGIYQPTYKFANSDLYKFVDWYMQYIGKLESTNKRRFVTGILGGLGCWSINLNITDSFIHRKT